MADYTLLQAQSDVAEIRGTFAHFVANASVINLTVNGIYYGPDGLPWTLGRQTQCNTNSIPVNSTTPSDVFTFSVGAARYQVHGILFGHNGGAGALQPQTMRLSGTATFLHTRVAVRSFRELEGQNTYAGQINNPDQDPSVTLQPTLNENFHIEFDGTVEFSAGGTFIIQARNATSGADVSWDVLSYSTAEIMPA